VALEEAATSYCYNDPTQFLNASIECFDLHGNRSELATNGYNQPIHKHDH